MIAAENDEHRGLRWFTVRDVAYLLAIREDSVRKLCSRGRLRCSLRRGQRSDGKYQRLLMIPETALMKYLEKRWRPKARLAKPVRLQDLIGP